VVDLKTESCLLWVMERQDVKSKWSSQEYEINVVSPFEDCFKILSIIAVG
jgi:hypothetical protein